MAADSTSDGGAPRGRAPRRWVPFLLFSCSGASGLMIQVLWRERLGQVFGATAEATAATLAAFFLGLGLGAWVWGRRAGSLRRPLGAYGALELAAVVTGLGYFAVLPLHGGAYAALLRHAPDAPALLAGVRVVLALLLLAPPAFFLGGTFPVLAEALVRREGDLGRTGPLLYALNTLGAAVGVVLAAFVLPPRIGFARSYVAALGLAAAVGAVATWIGRRGGPGPRRGDDRPPPPVPAAAAWLAGALAFASGLVAVGLEVAWIRMFAQAVPNSVYVFAIVLLTFLLFLVVGALLARWLAARRWRETDVLLGLLLVSSLLVTATPWAFLAATEGLTPPPPGLAWSAYLLRTAGIAVLVLGAPTLMLGAVFPYLLKVAEPTRESAGAIVGRLLALNTLGAVLGPLGVAFVLVPALGLWRTIGVLAFLYVLLAFVVARRGGGVRRQLLAGTALVAGAVALVPSSLPLVRLQPGERLVRAWEGAAGTVAVVDAPTSRKLVYNNVFTLGGTHDIRWEAMQAHVPLMVHADPRAVFFLGLGTGATAGGALDHAVEAVTVAELVPEVIEASRRYFGEFTNGLFADRRAHVLHADARHRLRWTDAEYDVVVGDLFFPWEPGTANLYTREHFEAVRARLRPGGLFAQWLPCYQLSPEEFGGIARTMVETFEQVTLWRGDFFARRPILALVGHERQATLDPERVVLHARQLLAGAGADLARDGASLPFHLYAGNLTAARGLLRDARLVTDDLPWITYSAPLSERGAARDGARRFTEGALLEFEAALARAVPPAEDPYLVRLSAGARQAVTGGLLFRRMAVALASFRQAEYARLRLRYRREVPAAYRSPVGAWVE